MSVQQSMKPGVRESRVYRYDTNKVAKYCYDHPFYQIKDGIVIPTTPELVVNYFHLRRRIGPEEVKSNFIAITNPLITEVRKFVSIIINGKEEWVEKFDSA